MNIKIENNKIQVGDISAFTNRTLYVVPETKDSVTFIFNDNLKKTVMVSDATVNDTQMTSDNIDELLADLFFLETEGISDLEDKLATKADLVGGYVPSYQLPSYVDDVIEGEFVNDTDFDVEGFIIVPERGKIYIDTITNLTYRWSGSIYVEISRSIALGDSEFTAFRGDHGKTAYDHTTQVSGNPHKVTKSDIGLSNVDNTSDINKPVSTAQTKAIQEAISNIDIIDTNILTNSSFFDNGYGWLEDSYKFSFTKEQSINNNYSVKFSNSGATTNINSRIKQSIDISKLEKGKQYTYSFYAYSPDVRAIDKGLEYGLVMVHPLGTDWNIGGFTLNSGEWTRVTKTFIFRNDCTSTFFRFQLPRNGTVFYSSPKLEIGDKARPWSLTSGDIQFEVSVLEARLKTLENK